MAARAELEADAAREGEERETARLFQLGSGVISVYVLLALLQLPRGSGPWYASLCALAILLPAVALARRGRLNLALALSGPGIYLAWALLVYAGGPNTLRVMSACMGIVFFGSALRPRATLLFGGLSLLGLWGLHLAAGASLYHLPNWDVSDGWLPILRQIGALSMVGAVLRVAHDRTVNGVHRAEQERRLAVAEVAKLNASLEARVDERTRELAALRDRQSELARRLAAELTADLTKVQKKIDAVRADPSLENDRRAHVERSAQAAARLTLMVERLHEHAQIGQSAFRRASFDMDKLAHEVVDETARFGDGARVAFRIAALPAAEGDATLVRVVLENLIGNAVKFSRTRAEPTVRIAYDRETGAYTVEDNGVGFDPAYASELYRPFRRLHPRTAFEGHGVGLANVKRIIDRHGGQVFASLTSDGGARFAFRLSEIEEAR